MKAAVVSLEGQRRHRRRRRRPDALNWFKETGPATRRHEPAPPEPSLP
jgi:hypothetical protein